MKVEDLSQFEWNSFRLNRLASITQIINKESKKSTSLNKIHQNDQRYTSKLGRNSPKSSSSIHKFKIITFGKSKSSQKKY